MFLKNYFWIPLLVILALTVGNYLPIASKDQAMRNPKKIAIICDMDGVLITTDGKAAFDQIGKRVCLQYAGSNLKNILNLKQLINTCLFDFLHTLKPGESPAYDAQGNRLPLIMCDWLAGRQTGNDMLTLVDNKLNNHNGAYSAIEEELLRNITKMMFTPESFIATRVFFNDAVDLVQAYKDQGHELYILSNWDAESFQLLKELNPEFFALFNGIVISGEVNTIKPEPAIYHYLLKTYGLDPKNCIFIDDRPENIEAAQKLGIQGVLCTSSKGPDFKEIQQQIDEHIDTITYGYAAAT